MLHQRGKEKHLKDFAILWRVGAHDSVVDEATRQMVITRTRVGINKFFFQNLEMSALAAEN